MLGKKNKTGLFGKFPYPYESNSAHRRLEDAEKRIARLEDILDEMIYLQRQFAASVVIAEERRKDDWAYSTGRIKAVSKGGYWAMNDQEKNDVTGDKGGTSDEKTILSNIFGANISASDDDETFLNYEQETEH